MSRRLWVICPFSRPQQLAWVLARFYSQSYKNKCLVLVYNGPAAAIFRDAPPGVTPLLSAYNVSDALNEGLRYVRAHAVEGDLFVKHDDDDYYGPEYLSQLAQSADNGAMAMGRTHIWCRSQGGHLWSLNYGHPDVNCPHGPTLAALVSLTVDFPPTGNVPWGEDAAWWRLMRNRGVHFTNGPRWGFCWYRYSEEDHQHTFPLNDRDMRALVVGDVHDHGDFCLQKVDSTTNEDAGTLLASDGFDFKRLADAIKARATL